MNLATPTKLLNGCTILVEATGYKYIAETIYKPNNTTEWEFTHLSEYHCDVPVLANRTKTKIKTQAEVDELLKSKAIRVVSIKTYPQAWDK